MDTVNIEINGQPIAADPSQTILEVVHAQGLDRIPTLCHSPELKPYGSCFVCVVEVEGRPNLLPACATRVGAGMKIQTRSERVVASRRAALELLLSNHYADCLSPCKLGCPAGVDVQGYIALAAMGEFRKAADLIRETNPLPAVCGRVCVRKCEGVCRRLDVDESVGINNIKRFITDSPGVYDAAPARETSRGQSVGIIGAGPAGLTAAWFLGRWGYDPVIYESMNHPGGMLRYGIPEYRLPKEALDREVDYICRAGAEIKLGVRVGRDVSLDDLMTRHQAVFIGAGAWGSTPMHIEGEFDTEGVRTGIDFLIEKAEQPTPVRGTVVVVGGGNTAMDVARTSWRLGADKVILLYRRTKAEMPADKLEIEDCIKEGIEILELAAPVQVIAENGKLRGLRCIRMKLGEPDASGRRRPIPMEGSEFELPCDLAMAAIGQRPVLEDLVGKGERAPALSKWQTVVVNAETFQTNVPGLFAGGDAADDGPTVVIDAIRDGQRAAKAIHAYLSGEPIPREPFAVRKDFWAKPGQAELGDLVKSPRQPLPEIHVEEREGNFREVATGLEYDDMMLEAKRCLSCGCLRFTDCQLRAYADEYQVDMKRFVGYLRKHRVDDRHPHISYDPNKCILCARCIRTCARVLPIAALGLVNRGFKTEMRPAMNEPLARTNCISCGNCIDACPTGALTEKYPFPGRADLVTAVTASRCAACSLGCAMQVKQFGPGRYQVTGPDRAGEYLCRYGRFGNELFIQTRRLTEPALRRGSERKPLSLPDAFAQVVGGLREIAGRFGPEAVGVFISPEATNEEMYLAARIAREGLGTANIGSLAVLGCGSEAGVLDASIGFTQSTADRGALAKADLIVCTNADPENDFAVLGVDVLEAIQRGAKLLVCSSAAITLDAHADVVLDPMRGRAALLWNGVIQDLLDSGHFDRAKAKDQPGGEAFLADMFDYGPANVATWTGVEAAKIHAAADLFRQAKQVVFLHGPDRLQDLSPGDASVLANFALLLRAAGQGAELLLPSMAANRYGLELMGADPAFRPGRNAADGLPGAHTHAALRALLAEGQLRAALVIGEDPLREDRTATWFRNLEFLVAMDWGQTETSAAADVALPNSTYLETAGTRCNFEGRLLRFERVLDPPAGQSGWEVLAGLAAALGVTGIGPSLTAISAEIDRVVREKLAAKTALYWNCGEPRTWDGQGRLVAVDVKTRPSPILPPLTVMERYKRDIREVGVERYRVR